MKISCHQSALFIAAAFMFSLFDFKDTSAQNKTIQSPEAAAMPAIDGIGNDLCWQNVPWQAIDQVWMPYGDSIASSDYFGRFKVVWSSKTNLLYFLVEVKDDAFVDGYVPGVTADIYNFDIIEVFIDEDASGGLHVFDGADSISARFGTNAENAFGYHIYASFPSESQVTKECYAGDLDGTSWSDVKSLNNASHLPEFALRKKGNTAVWEFALIVYNDSYEDNNKAAARAQLRAGKEIGLTLAYCDNDDPNEEPKTRDNFFGSVWVPAEANNDHWMNADRFGRMKLVSR